MDKRLCSTIHHAYRTKHILKSSCLNWCGLFFVGDFMAIQTVNLTVPGGDTPRSANTKINANFTDQNNAASKLLGTGKGQIPLAEDVAVAADIYFNTTYWTGSNVVDADNFKYGSKHSTVSAAVINSPPSILGDVAWTIRTYKIHPTTTQDTYALQVATGYNKPEIAIRNKVPLGWGEWTKLYSTYNTTKDSNGFIKAASPIVKVFADKVELNADAESQNVTYKKNGVGDYTITTQSGLSTDGWYIELPKEMNGNPKVAVTLSEEDGVISLKTYKRIFSMETFTFEPDLDNPLDIPDTRWIDLRLNEIPAEEVNP